MRNPPDQKWRSRLGLAVSMSGKSRIVNTLVRDCLYLNWALRADWVPIPPAPLRLEVHSTQEGEFVFVSALLFRHESLHFEGLPSLRVSYPQFHLRIHVLDHDDVASVWLRHVLVPTWLVPGIRWFGRQPAKSGRFRYPRPSSQIDRDRWRWTVSRRDSLVVEARQSSPCIGAGPVLGSWRQTVDMLRLRERAYVSTRASVRSITTRQRSVPLWPVEATIEDLGLVRTSPALARVPEWPVLHSSWLCPEIPFSFELARQPLGMKVGRSAAPVAPDPAMFRTSQSKARKTAA